MEWKEKYFEREIGGNTVNDRDGVGRMGERNGRRNIINKMKSENIVFGMGGEVVSRTDLKLALIQWRKEYCNLKGRETLNELEEILP